MPAPLFALIGRMLAGAGMRAAAGRAVAGGAARGAAAAGGRKAAATAAGKATGSTVRKKASQSLWEQFKRSIGVSQSARRATRPAATGTSVARAASRGASGAPAVAGQRSASGAVKAGLGKSAEVRQPRLLQPPQNWQDAGTDVVFKEYKGPAPPTAKTGGRPVPVKRSPTPSPAASSAARATPQPRSQPQAQQSGGLFGTAIRGLNTAVRGLTSFRKPPPPTPSPAASSAARATAPGKSAGDLRPLVQQVGQIASKSNPTSWMGRLGDMLGRRLERGVQGVNQARESGTPMSGMQSLLSAFTRQSAQREPVPPADQFPGLSPQQKLGMMGKSADEIGAAHSAEQEKQHQEAVEADAAQAMGELKDQAVDVTKKFALFGKGVVSTVVAMHLMPPAIKAATAKLIETRRQDARFSGRTAAAFADLDISRIQNQQSSAGNTSNSTKALIERQIKLEEQMKDELEAITTLVNKLAEGSLIVAQAALTVVEDKWWVKALKLLAGVFENTKKDQKPEHSVFGDVMKIAKQEAAGGGGKVKPLGGLQ
jgi:hypothetical protein